MGEDLDDRSTARAVGRPDTARTEKPQRSEERRFSRRTLFGAGVAAGTAVAMARAGLAGAAVTPAVAPRGAALPQPGASGIDHIVVVMMENRSFDHFLGWLPGANGKQAGLSYPDRSGELHPDLPPHHVPGSRLRRTRTIPYEGGRIESSTVAHATGGCSTRPTTSFRIGYYEQSDLAFLGRAAPYWTTARRLLRLDHGRDLPQPLLHALGADRPSPRHHRALPLCPSPRSGTAWRRQASGTGTTSPTFPFTALLGPQVPRGSRTPCSEFLLDCATGRLPAVSFVDPRFHRREAGARPATTTRFGDIRVGERVPQSRCTPRSPASPNWAKTVLVTNVRRVGRILRPRTPVDRTGREPGHRPAAAFESRPS